LALVFPGPHKQRCGRVLASGPCSKKNLAKLFPHYALKQTGRVQMKQTKGKTMFLLIKEAEQK